ncbi:intradiol ring-cleavage dioxygenase [Thalassobaculum litoreum]|uniref:Catechol 1,2-dioxygenase n=1 Tax=Thalassobaculum litoreum DSM 18839 TaxID=1123362 RepID=A0A8G2BKB4_9PROT|nr:intradiol ring-cleavage dioxygenase [Thalassobaculum litoreum]SDG20315.1 catechol 1,2-dioxygenase [Thalassobaculum litoreum DSM 18839]
MPGTEGSTSYFTEDTSVETVLARMGEPENPRLAEVMRAVIAHLHAVVKEVEPTYAEWMAAIRFLTETGRMCDDKRQEYILLSDVLGVSMLVDAINTRRPEGATENTVLGPFHVEGAPDLAMGDTISQDGIGEPLVVSGRVVDGDGRPVEGAVIDTWQTSHDGFYDLQQPEQQPENNLRGIFRTGADGRFSYRSVKPSFYPIPDDGPVGQLLHGLGRGNIRPAHLHYIVSAPGFETVTTHIFVHDDAYLDSDAVFGVKESLIRTFIRHDDPARAAEFGVANPFWTVETDFVLVPV